MARAKRKRTYGTGSVSRYLTPAGAERWRARWYINGKPDGKAGFLAKKDADDHLKIKLAAVAQKQAVEPNKLLFRDACQLWLEQEAAINVRPTTYEKYESCVRVHLLPRLGERRLKDLDEADISKFRAQLVKECGACTAQRAFDRTMTILRWCHRMGWIGRDLTTVTSRPKYSPEEAHPLGHDELIRFLADTGHERGPLWHLYAWTGLRLGEGLGLRWKDLDLEKGRLAVRQQVVSRDGPPYWQIVDYPKTDKSRRDIGIDSQLVALLKAHRKEQVAIRLRTKREWNGRFDLVFCTEQGLPWSPNNVRRAFKGVAKRCRITGRNVHDLRHTHATRLLSAGEPLNKVSARLGHANPGITARVYAHWIPGDDQSTVETIERIKRGQRAGD